MWSHAGRHAGIDACTHAGRHAGIDVVTCRQTCGNRCKQTCRQTCENTSEHLRMDWKVCLKAHSCLLAQYVFKMRVLFFAIFVIVHSLFNDVVCFVYQDGFFFELVLMWLLHVAELARNKVVPMQTVTHRDCQGSHRDSLSRSLMHLLTRSPTHSSTHSLTHSLTNSRYHSPTYPPTHSLT
jgi:hypothetical protein